MPSMARFGRAKKALKTGKDDDADSSVPASPTTDTLRPPRVSLPHVGSELNMHQHNGLFDVESDPPSHNEQHPTPTTLEPSTGWSSPPSSISLATLDRRDLYSSDERSSMVRAPAERMSPPAPHSHYTNGGANPTNGDASTEWSSAVGHAATGKSGRVIHNLQEDIARLTRECGVYRARAEETQRMNDAFKTQVQNMTERLRNFEQANETNLQSIARKDRKIEELRADVQAEKERRLRAEGEASKANRLMDENREGFHRRCAELQDMAHQSQTQYDVLAKSGQRERADLARRLKTLKDEFLSLKKKFDDREFDENYLEDILTRKDRELQVARENFDKLSKTYDLYKKAHDDDVRKLVENGRQGEARINAGLASLRQTERDMRWIMRLHKEDQKNQGEGE